MRIAVVVHSYYPSDPRVRKEVGALTAAGHTVGVVCLKGATEAPNETIGSVRVHRKAVSRQRSRGRFGYLLEYLRFFLLATLELSRLDRTEHVDVVHVHNVPDQLIYCAVFRKMSGSRLVLDLHDPMPELFLDKYGLGEGSRSYRLLKRWQLKCCKFADNVIVSSEPMRDDLVARGIAFDRVSVVINGSEHDVDNDAFVLVYFGSVFERYGLEVVLRGISLTDRVHLLVFASDVDPRHLRHLRHLAEDLGVSDRVVFSGRIEPGAIVRGLARADAGIVPARRSPHMDLVYPTKLFDCLALGLDVIAARTPPVEAALGDVVVYYEPDDEHSFARAVAGLMARRRPLSPSSPRSNRLPEYLRWRSIAPHVAEAVAGTDAGLATMRETRGVVQERPLQSAASYPSLGDEQG